MRKKQHIPFQNESNRASIARNDNSILEVDPKLTNSLASKAHIEAQNISAMNATGKGKPSIRGVAGIRDVATQLELNSTNNSSISNKPQAIYGELYENASNNKVYMYMGTADGMGGYAIDVETGDKIPVSYIRTLLQDANRVKDPNVKLGELNMAAMRRLSQINKQRLGQRSIFLDFETRMKDLTIDGSYKNITELSIRSEHLRGSTVGNLPGNKLDLNNVKQLSFIFDVQAKDAKMARLFRTVANGVKRQEGRMLLHDNVEVKGPVVSATDILDALKNRVSKIPEKNIKRLDIAKANVGWMEEYIRQSGDNSVFMFESDFKNPANMRAYMDKFWKNLHGAKEKGTNVYGFNTTAWDDMIAENLSGKRVGMMDLSSNVKMIYSHLFPEASSGTIDAVNRYKPLLRQFEKEGMGKGVTSDVMTFFSRGMKQRYASRTNQEDVYNYIVERIAQRGSGVGLPELHSGSDNAMAGRVLSEIIDPARFFNKAQQFYADMNMNLKEGVVHDTVRLIFADNYIKNHPKYHGKLEDYKSIRTEALAKFDEAYRIQNTQKVAITRTEKLTKHNSPAEMKAGNLPTVAHRIRPPDSKNFRETIESTLGTSGVNSLLSALVLGGSINYVTEKVKNIRNKVSAVEQPEGMSHASLQTVVRRLALTDFGSSWRGVVSTTIKETAKLLFKNNTPGHNAKELLSSWNKTFKRGSTFGHMFRNRNVTKTINNIGKTMASELKISDKKLINRIGNKLSEFTLEGKFSAIKRKSLDNISHLTGGARLSNYGEALTKLTESPIYKEAKPWVKFGFGTAMATRLMARLPFTAKENPEFQDVQPRDTYQKAAFEKKEYVSNQRGTYSYQPDRMSWFQKARRQTLQELGILKDKGIGPNVSDSTKYRRQSMTDFGSSLKLDSVTTTEFALRSMVDGGIKNNLPATPVLQIPKMSPDAIRRFGTRMVDVRSSAVAQNNKENFDIAKQIHNDTMSIEDSYIRNPGLYDMQYLTKDIDPVNPFIERTPKPVVSVPTASHGPSIGIKMNPKVLDNITRSSKNDYLPDMTTKVAGTQYDITPMKAGDVYGKLNRNNSDDLRIQSLTDENKMIQPVAGLVLNRELHPSISGSSDIERRSGSMMNYASPVIGKAIRDEFPTHTDNIGTYGKMNLEATGNNIIKRDSGLGEFNMFEVAKLTYDSTNEPMGHNAAAWNTNDHLYES